MIDPLLSLAFSMHANKGVYALLIGSGVSRSAKIPTGWEIVLELVKRVAALEGEDHGSDPMTWYRERYSEELGYSNLLQQLGQTASDRSQILKEFFEPSSATAEEGWHQPTPAHHAIARLMRDGFIRVTVTTNFDRLLEKALLAIGVQPQVLSTSEAIQGSRPLIHSGPTIIKVNGDYGDERIRNTLVELDAYEPSLDQLLDRVWSEFGLVVCGWSADWDTALRRSIERCANHRFGMHWVAKDELTEAARSLVRMRRGNVIRVAGADEFFRDIDAKVLALDVIAQPHPLSARVASETLKTYLVEDRYRIRLEELVVKECERVRGEIETETFRTSGPAVTREELGKRVTQAEALSETLVGLVSTGSYWGEPRHSHLWSRCLTRLGTWDFEGGFEAWESLRWWPALLVLYASGISALAAKKFETFTEVARRAEIRRRARKERAASMLASWSFDHNLMNLLPRLPRVNGTYTYPLSRQLRLALREPLSQIIHTEQSYEQLFDLFEYLLSLSHFSPDDAGSFPGGEFLLRSRLDDDRSPAQFLDEMLSKDPRVALHLADYLGVGESEALSRASAFKAATAKRSTR